MKPPARLDGRGDGAGDQPGDGGFEGWRELSRLDPTEVDGAGRVAASQAGHDVGHRLASGERGAHRLRDLTGLLAGELVRRDHDFLHFRLGGYAELLLALAIGTLQNLVVDLDLGADFALDDRVHADRARGAFAKILERHACSPQSLEELLLGREAHAVAGRIHRLVELRPRRLDDQLPGAREQQHLVENLAHRRPSGLRRELATLLRGKLGVGDRPQARLLARAVVVIRRDLVVDAQDDGVELLGAERNGREDQYCQDGADGSLHGINALHAASISGTIPGS